jgi:hypothetical protein
MLGIVGLDYSFAIAARIDFQETETRALLGGELFELVYHFTSVADDGEQGSVDRKTATSIHCTNIDPVEFTSVEVRV